jgi:hypothetical protein
MISSHEGSRELAALRRRAYGPDADIQNDPEALRRLNELEDLARRSTVIHDDRPVDVPDQDDDPADAEELIAAASPDGPAAPEARAAAPAPSSSKRGGWIRRVPIWAIAAVCLVVGLVAGAAAMSISARSQGDAPDQILTSVGDSTDLSVSWISSLTSWGVAPSSVVQYQPFDTLDLWVGETSLDAKCLLVSHMGRIFTAACAEKGLSPVLDLTIDPSLPVHWDHPLPTGTVVRFIARDDGVDVWVREPVASQSAPSP